LLSFGVATFGLLSFSYRGVRSTTCVCFVQAAAAWRPSRTCRGYTSCVPKYENANSYWLTHEAKGKSVVDVGCMWGVTGDYSFLAEESGASQVVGVDIYPAMDAFLEKKKA